jgi:hypothetical protein
MPAWGGQVADVRFFRAVVRDGMPSGGSSPVKKTLLASLCFFALLPYGTVLPDANGPSKDFGQLDSNKPVLCLLPGRVRKVGGIMTYLERRKPAEITASECEIRGGEYTLFDRANYETALAIWLESAEQGDAAAQLHVGEIYEKGWLGEPDYGLAAAWYQKAAEQGDRHAQSRLAYLVQSGLGVERDSARALALWQSALGIKEDLVLASEVEAAKSEAQREINRLLAALERQNLSTGRLQASLEASQSEVATQQTRLHATRAEVDRLQQQLAGNQAGAGADVGQLRELEQQLAERQALVDEQQIAIELLQADVSAREAQVSASIRQAEVRERQLASARASLESEAARGDSLLRKLEEQQHLLMRMERELGNAESRLAESRDEKDLLEQQLRGEISAAGALADSSQAEVQKELSRARQLLEKRESELAELKTQADQSNSDYARRIDEMREALQAGLAERESLEAEIQQQRAELAASTDQQRVETNSRIETAEREVARLEQQMKEAQAQLADERRVHEAQLQAVNQGLVESRKEVAVLQSQLQSEKQVANQAQSQDEDVLKAKLEFARGVVATRETELASLRNELSRQREKFDAELAAAKLRESDLSSALASSREEKSGVAAELEQADKELRAMREEMRETLFALASARAGEETLQGELSELNQEETARRSELSRSLKAQASEAERLRKERDVLRRRWQQTVEQRDKIRQQLTTEVDRRSWLEVELESAKNKLATARHELTSLNRALNDAQAEKLQLSQSVATLRSDLDRNLARTMNERRRMEAELSRSEARLSQVDQGVGELRREKARLEGEIDFYSTSGEAQALSMRGSMPSQSLSESLPPGVRTGPYRAVIIANYEYDYLPDLRSPPHDANKLKQLLEREYGFDVDVEINLGRSEMFQLLRRLRDAREKEFLVVYYAGHGKMDEFGDGYWLPTDYRESLPLTDAVSIGDLTQTLRHSSAQHVLVVADSCYSGALLRDANPVIRKSVPALIKYWVANRSRTVLTSGGMAPVLDEGPDNHSVFASALLEVLRNNNGVINGETLHAEVHDRVAIGAARLGYLDQKPQFAAIEDAGHENGQFVFVRPGG